MKGLVPHPIPYQGSKRNIALKILQHFPRHVKRVVEPFAGSAAMSLAASYYGIAESFWINDGHEALVALWKEIIDAPEDLCDGYEKLWNEQLGQEREFYDKVRSAFNETHDPASFLYLLARCVKAAIRYNSNGQFNNSPDNRRKGARPDTMRARVVGASELLRGAKVSCLDYRKVLPKCTKNDLIYMDPPYQGVCGNRDNRYAPTIDHEEFCDALAKLVAKDRMFIVSYDGRSGDKTYGEPLPESLGCLHVEVAAGVSTQATLLGRKSETVESLYISPSLRGIEDTFVHSQDRQQSFQFT